MRNQNTAVAQLLANTLYQCANEGASLNVDFESPTEGYMVSIIDGPNFPNLSSVNPLDVAAFIKEEGEDGLHRLFDHTDLYAGVWINEENGRVHFDISEKCLDKQYALALADEMGQEAIYDVKACKDIRL